jgi:hypothetical protein
MMQVFNAISKASAASPLLSGVIFGTSRGLIGDSSAQRLEGRGSTEKFEQDWRRTATYVTWSNCVVLFYESLVYRLLFPRIFPTYIGGKFIRSNVIKATLVDNLFIVPALYFPAFYAFKDSFIPTLDGLSPASPIDNNILSPEKIKRSLTEAMSHYKHDFFVQNASSMLFWAPTGYIMFKYAPPAHRVAFSSVLSCCYVLILSTATQFLEKERQAPEVARLMRRATKI